DCGLRDGHAVTAAARGSDPEGTDATEATGRCGGVATRGIVVTAGTRGSGRYRLGEGPPRGPSVHSGRWNAQPGRHRAHRTRGDPYRYWDRACACAGRPTRGAVRPRRAVARL